MLSSLESYVLEMVLNKCKLDTLESFTSIEDDSIRYNFKISIIRMRHKLDLVKSKTFVIYHHNYTSKERGKTRLITVMHDIIILRRPKICHHANISV